MASTSETGHAKNVANFNQLISVCTGYGERYNPSNSQITLEALKTLGSASQQALEAVNSALPAYNNSRADRENAFNTLNSRITRVINALKAVDPQPELLENAKSLVRRLRGKRAAAKLTEEEKQELMAQGKEVHNVSTSQLSFDNRINNFDKLVKLLASIPQYTPNEEDLKVEAQQQLLDELNQTNTAVVDAETKLDNVRMARNKILYTEDSGLVDVAMDVKNYAKSIFNASSPEYKQLSGLRFRREKH